MNVIFWVPEFIREKHGINIRTLVAEKGSTELVFVIQPTPWSVLKFETTSPGITDVLEANPVGNRNFRAFNQERALKRWSNVEPLECFANFANFVCPDATDDVIKAFKRERHPSPGYVFICLQL